MRKYITTLGLALGAIGLFGQEQFSLDDCVSYAMENAAQIKIEKKDIEDAEGQILEYKSIGIPKVYLGSNYTYYPQIAVVPVPDFITPATYEVLFNEGLLEPKEVPSGELLPAQFGTNNVFDAGLSLSSLLFDFSWIQGLKAQQMYRDLVVRELDVAEYQVRSQITRAYMAVLISERTVELIEDNLSNIQDLLDETQALYENGFAEKLDVDRLVLSRDNLATELQNVERSIDVTENLLKFQMGYPVEQDIELTDEFESLADRMVVEGADLTSEIDYYARPEYRALALTEELNQINQKVIKAGYMPSLSLDAGYSQTIQRNDIFNDEEAGWFPSSYVGVSLSMPIFDGLERKAELQRAKVNEDKVAIQKANFENNMTMEVRNARIDYINSAQTVEARQNAMDLAQDIYNTTQIKYREGVGSSVELTQAESELYDSQTNYINALYELIVAKTDLDIALGKM